MTNPPQKLDGHGLPIPGVFNLGTNQVLAATAAVANSETVIETSRIARIATTHDIYFKVGPAPVAATGSIRFADVPAADDTIVINGVTFTFKASGAAGNEINIGADVDETLANAALILEASVEVDVDDATYTTDAYDADTGYGYLNITHDTPGEDGNAFTLAVSGADLHTHNATLTGGDDGDAIATTSCPLLTAGKEILVAVDEGWRLSVLRVSADGVVSFTEMK